MAKTHSQFTCQRCGRITAAFVGKCPQCGEFGSMVEQVIRDISVSDQRWKHSGLVQRNQPVKLSDLTSSSKDRLTIDITEFSRVIGGGFVGGSLLLMGGDPGIGKSTLLLVVAARFSMAHGRVLYVSGEESARQIKMRADRLGTKADNLYLVTETNLELILEHVADIKPKLVVVDSIQTTFTDNLSSSAGTISQVKECAARFQEFAKNQSVTIILVGHVTKEGNIAGPRVLEHIVDTVLYLEGDPFHRFRLLRCVKNRFGATNEVGVFEMHERGLLEVPNPSKVFIAERQVNTSGSAIAVTLEGTRPILVEIQALVNASAFSNPRRSANGIDYQRLVLLAAILERRANIRLHDKDIYANVVSGLQVKEPAVDLTIAVAIASSMKNRSIRADTAIIGELGLSGEVRSVSHIDWRLNEAMKLGFKRCVIPKASTSKSSNIPSGLDVQGVNSLSEALEISFARK